MQFNNWIQIYTCVKMLADGNLQLITGESFRIDQVLLKEPNKSREYRLNGVIKIYDGNNGNLIDQIPIKTFVEQSQILYNKLKNAKGRSFEFPTIEKFLNSIDVENLTALKTDKSDIRIVVHDLNTGMKPTLGFSIKSMLGKRSTLFNPGAGTNFIYKLNFSDKKLKFDFQKFNRETFANPRISTRLSQLEDLGVKIDFNKIQSENLQLNLELIDSQLPKIISYLVLYKYRERKSKLIDLLELINKENPLNFDTSKGHPFYEYKIKNFMVDSALGMTPETVWKGTFDATGGIIIVKESGDLVCYHIYNRNEFENYLLNNTKLEQASTSEDRTNPGFPVPKSSKPRPKPYNYGWVYEEEGEFYIKLNLQIRFS